MGPRAALIFDDRAISAAELADRAARLAGGLAASAWAPATAWRCGCPTAPSGWSCTSRSPASARSPSPSTRASAPTRCAICSSARRRGRSPSPRASRASTSRAILGEAGAAAEPIRVGEPAYEALLDHEPAPDASSPDAPCVAFTSSGTTGRPKLVVHAQRGIVAHARAVAAGFGYDAPDCVALAMLPLCGVFGYDSALGALAGGATVVLQEAFDAAEAAALVARHRVTHANGSDAMVLRLLEAAPDPPLREAGFAAFDGDPRAVVDAADAAGTTAYMCYGSTEVQALLAHAPQDGTPERRAIAGGAPVSPETEVRVSDDGELEIRGPSVMAGYLGDEEPPTSPRTASCARATSAA